MATIQHVTGYVRRKTGSNPTVLKNSGFPMIYEFKYKGYRVEFEFWSAANFVDNFFIFMPNGERDSKVVINIKQCIDYIDEQMRLNVSPDINEEIF